MSDIVRDDRKNPVNKADSRFIEAADKHNAASAYTMTDPNITAILARHGVSDPMAYMLGEGENPKLVASKHPDVRMRGSIYMILGRMKSFAEMTRGFRPLKDI